MLLILQITQLDYGDAALCALSALRGRAEDPGSAASRLLEALESVPPELIRRLLDAIPDRDKAALAASLARENEARIRELAGLLGRLPKARQEQLAARLLQSASGRAAALIEEEAAKRGLRLKLGRLSASAGWSA